MLFSCECICQFIFQTPRALKKLFPPLQDSFRPSPFHFKVHLLLTFEPNCLILQQGFVTLQETKDRESEEPLKRKGPPRLAILSSCSQRWFNVSGTSSPNLGHNGTTSCGPRPCFQKVSRVGFLLLAWLLDSSLWKASYNCNP